MRDMSEYYARMIGKLIDQQVTFHVKQLHKHTAPSQYIADLISKILNNKSSTYPCVLNELGVYFFEGSHGFVKDIDTASECFSFAFAHGTLIAGLHLAATLMCLPKTELKYAIQLFSLLESTMKKGCLQFKGKRNELYYLGGILFFRTQNHEESRRCFEGVRKYHLYRSSAREYMARIDIRSDNKSALKK